MIFDMFICLKTFDSYPPYNPNKNKYKLVKQITDFKIKTEIDLFLLARNICFNLINFLNNNTSISEFYSEKKLLNEIKWKLPSQYDLFDVFWYYDKEIIFINLQYTTFSKTSLNKKCRTAILINFREIIALLKKINSNINNIQYKKLYQITLFAYELWLELANKEISRSLSALTKREIFGKF
jgi:hypothetical protein